jgi:hypothetical protein
MLASGGEPRNAAGQPAGRPIRSGASGASRPPVPDSLLDPGGQLQGRDPVPVKPGETRHGGYALTRMRRRGGGSPGWLPVKLRDEAASRGRGPQRARPGSVRTGRTVEEIAGQGQTASDTMTAQPGHRCKQGCPR